MMRIGVDTGGTFTDFVFFDGSSVKTDKRPSTPHNPAESILAGIEAFETFDLVHGTTVATNAFLQKKLAKSAFVSTAGFEHLLHIGRQNRVGLFDLEVKKPDSIVPLSLCYGLKERTLHTGEVETPLERKEVEGLCGELRRRRVESVGVVFLHSYSDPENEKIAADILRKNGFYVTASHEIMPEYREYERAVITMLNTALKPIIARYVGFLKQSLAGNPLSIMQSNGGVLSPERIMDEPVRTLTSGPAGGVIAAKYFAQLGGMKNLITLDMGGTSSDVSMIKEGELTLTREANIEHLPLRIPVIDITTVGAGGGSIAKIDRGGVLQVGPESAGADPGPACYGKSNLATVTDAFVVNGVIDPDLFLGGRMAIRPERSLEVVDRLAARLGKTRHQAAEGIIAISVSAMERAIRSVTLEKGEDPRRYTLFPFGGAGAMVATMLADRLGMSRILVPPYQGVFSALGMLMSDFQKQFSRSVLKRYSAELRSDLDEVFEELTAEARTVLKHDGFSKETSVLLPELDLRYRGQSYELTVPFEEGYHHTFHEKHRRLYSYSLDDDECEVVNARLLAVGRTPTIRIRKRRAAGSDAEPIKRKGVFFNGSHQQFAVYLREGLAPGHRIEGPAVIAGRDSTVVVAPDFKAEVDPYASLILTRKS